MKPYYVFTLIFLLLTDLILLVMINHKKKACDFAEDQIIELQKQKQNFENNIKKYYSKNEIIIYDFDLQRIISDKTSDDYGLFFRFLVNACDVCINEQIAILNEEFQKLNRKGISLNILIDDSINLKKRIHYISSDLQKKIFYINRCNLDKMVNDETSYYFWIEDGKISNIFYPVPGSKSTTISYLNYIKNSKDNKLFY